MTIALPDNYFGVSTCKTQPFSKEFNPLFIVVKQFNNLTALFLRLQSNQFNFITYTIL